MDKQTIRIIVLSVLLTGLAYAIYRISETGFNFYIGAALVLAGAIAIYWAYQYITKLIERRKGAKREMPKFAELHSLENPWVKGEITFFLEVHMREPVELNILDKEDNVVVNLMSTEKDPGGHPIKFDSTRYKDGIYYYQLITPNQKTIKKMAIRNND